MLAFSQPNNSFVSKNSHNQVSIIYSSPRRNPAAAIGNHCNSNNALSNRATARGTDQEENKSIVISHRNRVGSNTSTYSINNATETTSPHRHHANMSLRICQGGTGAKPDSDEEMEIEVPVRLEEFTLRDDYVPVVEN